MDVGSVFRLGTVPNIFPNKNSCLSITWEYGNTKGESEGAFAGILLAAFVQGRWSCVQKLCMCSEVMQNHGWVSKMSM